MPNYSDILILAGVFSALCLFVIAFLAFECAKARQHYRELKRRADAEAKFRAFLTSHEPNSVRQYFSRKT